MGMGFGAGPMWGGGGNWGGNAANWGGSGQATAGGAPFAGIPPELEKSVTELAE